MTTKNAIRKMILVGDINLLGMEDPAVPFARFEEEFGVADIVFGNLECCLYDPPEPPSPSNEAFIVPAGIGGEALKRAGMQAVGIANNINFGEAEINASIATLDKLGILHTGAGPNRTAARAPIILERNGLRVGILQRTSVYWPVNHEATDDSAGVAVIRGHTAYESPYRKSPSGYPPANRPGVPPHIVTWADKACLQQLQEDVRALRQRVDIVVASFHWGLNQDVLEYMHEIARAAVDAGADVVMGHGPHHYSLPIEVYKDKPILYGLGAFSFQTGHHGVNHGHWVGLLARVTVGDKKVKGASVQFVRQNLRMEVRPCSLWEEQVEFESLRERSKVYGTVLKAHGDQIQVECHG